MIGIVSHAFLLVLAAPGPAVAQQAEVTLVCSYPRLPLPGPPGNFLLEASKTYHLSDGSWHETPTTFWQEGSDAYGSWKITIDRATAIATETLNGASVGGSVTRQAQCRKFEGRQF